MVEIAPEVAGSNQLLKVTMCGHENAHIDGGGLGGADALDLALFQHAQQLGLHGRRHIADLVKKESAAMGLLEFARVALGRAGKRSFLVAEELALDQLSGHGRAVQRHKWTCCPVALLVQCARHQFFAGAGLAVDADADFAGGYTLNLRNHAAHGLA